MYYLYGIWLWNLLQRLQHYPKFCLAFNFRASLEFLLDDCTHSSSPCGLVRVFATALLNRSMASFFMLVTMSFLQPCFGHTQGLFFVCTRCVHYVNIYCTHTQSCTHYSKSVVMVIQRSITNVVLIDSNCQLVMLSMCVWMVLVVSSSSHVSLCLQDCVCTFSLAHTLSHVVEALTTRSPSNNQTFTPPSSKLTITQKSVEAPSKPLQVAMPSSLSINPLVVQPESLTRQSPRDCLP